jgi:hypothetical protein
MNYKIKINYDTGDSYYRYPGKTHILELSWSSLENAESNLTRIKEHYKLYESIHRNYSSDKTILEFKTKDWYVEENTNLIKLYSDDGKPWQILPTWVGFFETLNYCVIINF